MKFFTNKSLLLAGLALSIGLTAVAAPARADWDDHDSYPRYGHEEYEHRWHRRPMPPAYVYAPPPRYVYVQPAPLPPPRPVYVVPEPTYYNPFGGLIFAFNIR